MLWPLLHRITYDAGAFPLGGSHARFSVQSVTPTTRRFFGADEACRASTALEFPNQTSPIRMATMHDRRVERCDMVEPSLLKEARGRTANSVPWLVQKVA